MSAADNKALVEAIFAGEKDMFEQFADDAVWRIAGRREFVGKQAMMEELFGPLVGLMESMGRVVPTNVIAEGDQVVVEAKAEGRVTKKGEAYNPDYCFVYRIENGKITRLTEYADLALAERVLPELAL